MVKLSCVFIAFFCLILPSQAQLSEIKSHTEALCSSAFHGRGYVNSGDSLASEYIKKYFEKNEIAPINGNYFQSFSFNVNTFPGNMDVVHNEKKLIPGKHFLVHPSSSGAVMQIIPKKISVKELLDSKVLLSTIEQLQNDTLYNGVLLDFTKITADTLKLIQPIGEELSAIFPIIEVTDRKFTWSVSTKTFANTYIQVQDSIYDEGATFDINITSQFTRKHESRNVIGIVPSKIKTDDFVVFTAHYDHLGRMGESTYFPGANDNASGTAILLEMARKIKDKPLNVNAVFIAFAGEEAGLIGSNYFVNHPEIQLQNIRFLINTDIMGSGEEGITVVNATLHDKAFQLLKKINKKKKLVKEIKSRGPAANSDHYWFSQEGVPSFFIYTMGPNKNYHDIFDTYSNLSFAATENVFELIYAFAKKVKN
jgi:hypothetical protein